MNVEDASATVANELVTSSSLLWFQEWIRLAGGTVHPQQDSTLNIGYSYRMMDGPASYQLT